jgi:uncharacterized membrane protein YczE
MIKRLPSITGAKAACYLAGCLLFSFGVKLLITADLGVDPYHAMVLGLVRSIGVPGIEVGMVSGALTILVLLIWARATRNRLLISPFLTMFLVGWGVDLLNWIHIEAWLSQASSATLASRLTLLVVGLLADAYASALIIASGFGIRVMDLVALSLAHGPLKRFTIAKSLLEIVFVTTAYVAGGPVGIATLLFVVLVALLIEPMMLMNRRLFGLELHRDLVRPAAAGRVGRATHEPSPPAGGTRTERRVTGTAAPIPKGGV